jgi:hypothetical protein
MKASSLSFQAAVLLVVVGMIWGIVMAISQDHSAMAAHAHLNLLGWVSLFCLVYSITFTHQLTALELHSYRSGLGLLPPWS